MNRRQFVVALALSAAALGLSGCPQGEEGGADTIKIAVAGPMTGSAANFGDVISKAAKLAVAQINEQGGIDGRMVELVIEDDKADTNEATNVAKKIVGDEDVSIVIGHFNSTCSNAAKDTYNRAGIVQFSPGSTNVRVCRGSDWTFRNLYHDTYQGIVMARYVKQILGHDRAAIAYDNDDYGRGLKEAIETEAAEIGLEIVGAESYIRERTQDFKTLASALKGANPQTVMIAGLYNEAALITKAIRNDLGWSDVQIFGADGVMDETFISQGGTAAEGALVATPFFYSAEASEAAQAFGAAYAEMYEGAQPNTWAALTYDAVNMALQAIDEQGTDRAAIKEWFASRRGPETGFHGVTGMTYFDEHGDCPSKPAQIVRVVNGAYQLAEKQLKAEDIQ